MKKYECLEKGFRNELRFWCEPILGVVWASNENEAMEIAKLKFPTVAKVRKV